MSKTSPSSTQGTLLGALCALLGAVGALPGALRAGPWRQRANYGSPGGGPRRRKHKIDRNHCTVDGFLRDRGVRLTLFLLFWGRPVRNA